jgi:hypothetical protein
MAKLDANDVVAQAAALRAAEMTVAAETLRSRIMSFDPSGIAEDKLTEVAKLTEQLVRLDSAADRATRRLAELLKNQASDPTADAYDQFLKDQESDQ